MIGYTCCPRGFVLECIREQRFPKHVVEFAEGYIMTDEIGVQELILAVALVHELEPEQFVRVSFSLVGAHLIHVKPHFCLVYTAPSLSRFLAVTTIDGELDLESFDVSKAAYDQALEPLPVHISDTKARAD